MSRSVKPVNPMRVPKKDKRFYRKSLRQAAKQAVHHGRDPERERTTYAWWYW